jgi:hypothetical protein
MYLELAEYTENLYKIRCETVYVFSIEKISNALNKHEQVLITQ